MTDRNEDKLLAAASRLNTGIPPQRDLWPEIAASIAEPKRSWWTPMLAQAAAIVLLVGASSAVTYLLVSDDGGRSWTEQYSAPENEEPLFDVLFEDRDRGPVHELERARHDRLRHDP